MVTGSLGLITEYIVGGPGYQVRVPCYLEEVPGYLSLVWVDGVVGLDGVVGVVEVIRVVKVV